ncbi:MAG: DUF342 domain-containing protein [Desulfobacterales bacterium]|nr:DUF342 domain-containing protein [Desulfobacterales bacterium]
MAHQQTLHAEITNALPIIVRLAVKYNLLTEKQILMALSAYRNQREKERECSFEEYLLAQGILREEMMKILIPAKEAWELRCLDKQFGSIAIINGFATQQQIDAALKEQARLLKEENKKILIGDLLIKHGLVTPKQCKMILMKQARLKQSSEPQAQSTQSVQPEKTIDQPSVTCEPDETKLVSKQSQETASKPVSSEIPVEIDEKAIYGIKVSDDKMTAVLYARKVLLGEVAVEDIKQYLKEKYITFGVVSEEIIALFIQDTEKGINSLEIAKGFPSQEGKSSKLRYFFETNPLKSGLINEDGEIDFKNRGDIPMVKPGDILAQKTEMVRSIPGINVYGENIEVEEAKDILLRCERGTEISEDGLKVLAKVNGQPKLLLGDKFAVLNELRVKSDVGFETGHVHFEGNVFVSGMIKSGFNVHCANLTTTAIQEAEIECSGDITVIGGITGATINTKGGIVCKYINKAKIIAFGDIIVQKEIIDSEIQTSGKCILIRGKIISSEISSKFGMEVLDIGTDISSPCKIRAGVDDHILKEMAGIESAIKRREDKLKELKNKRNELQKKEIQLQQEITQFAHVQDRSQIEIRTLKNDIKSLPPTKKREIAELEQRTVELARKANQAGESIEKCFNLQDQVAEELEKLEVEIKPLDAELTELRLDKIHLQDWCKQNKGIAVVKASGKIYAGTIICGIHSALVVKETLRRVEINEVKNTDPDSTTEYEMRITR